MWGEALDASRVPWRGDALGAALREMLALDDSEFISAVVDRASATREPTTAIAGRIDADLAMQWKSRTEALGRLPKGAAMTAALVRFVETHQGAAMLTATLAERSR